MRTVFLWLQGGGGGKGNSLHHPSPWGGGEVGGGGSDIAYTTRLPVEERKLG